MSSADIVAQLTLSRRNMKMIRQVVSRVRILEIKIIKEVKEWQKMQLS